MQSDLAKFCSKLQSEIIASQKLNNSFGVAKLNSLSACVAHLAAVGNLAELAQFSSRYANLAEKKTDFDKEICLFFCERSYILIEFR